MLTEAGVRPGSRARLTSLLRRIGLDRAIGFTLLNRVWSVGAGIVTLLMLTHFLSPVEQGFYFTFTSLMSLQVFFELGLSYVIVHFASHDVAHLAFTAEGLLEGDAAAKSRLGALLRVCMLWYGIISLAAGAILLPSGMAFFAWNTPPGIAPAWQLPWGWIVLVWMISLASVPLYALLEGCGQIAQVAKLQTAQNVASSLMLWAVLARGGALLAAPAGITLTLIMGGAWLWRNKRRFLVDLLNARRPEAGMSWKRDIWPFQWKIAVSWISGYFVFKIFNPLLFRFHGPVAAGQMGLSIVIMDTIAAIALAWITTKTAPFGSLIAKREFAELDRRFFPCLWQSLAVVVIGGAAFWMGDWCLFHLHHALSHRLLPPIPLAMLICGTIVMHIIGSEAVYLRSHKQEPFLWLSLTMGILIAFFSVLLGRPYAATGMMGAYFGVNLLIGLTGGTWIFQRKRHEWHR